MTKGDVFVLILNILLGTLVGLYGPGLAYNLAIGVIVSPLLSLLYFGVCNDRGWWF